MAKQMEWELTSAMALLNLLAAPVAIVALLHAWIIPELYALRGANVVRQRRETSAPESIAQGFLGDLLNHDARELQRTTGLAMERGHRVVEQIVGPGVVGAFVALLAVVQRAARC